MAPAPQGRPRLPRSFFAPPVTDLARRLLGQTLVRIVDGRRLSGRIVEVEAYLGAEDRAAHTFGGRRTARNEVMYRQARARACSGRRGRAGVLATWRDRPPRAEARAFSTSTSRTACTSAPT